MKQASRCWNEKFTSFLVKFKFKVSQADNCVFVNNDSGKKILLAIYIDDGLIAASSENDIGDLVQYLNREFKTKTGNLECYLGIEVDQGIDGSIHIHQNAYSRKILKRFNMDECNAVAIPADQHHSTSSRSYPNEEEENALDVPYREAVGSLMYLAVATRPDIAYAVGTVSQYLANPKRFHWNAVKRIFKYIKGTLDYGIFFVNKVNLNLNGFSDADYARDEGTRKSTSGYAFMLGSSIVSWCSQKQRTVALLTTESEYVAACQSIKELVWLKLLMAELISNNSITLYMDNQCVIRLIQNPEFHKRTKHIDVRYHFIREKFRDGVFQLEYVHTSNQLADIFTKPLNFETFKRLRELIGIVSIK